MGFNRHKIENRRGEGRRRGLATLNGYGLGCEPLAGWDVAGNPLRLVSGAAGWRHLINFLRWIFELRAQSACVLGAQSNGRKGLINTDCQ